MNIKKQSWLYKLAYLYCADNKRPVQDNLCCFLWRLGWTVSWSALAIIGGAILEFVFGVLCLLFGFRFRLGADGMPKPYWLPRIGEARISLGIVLVAWWMIHSATVFIPEFVEVGIIEEPFIPAMIQFAQFVTVSVSALGALFFLLIRLIESQLAVDFKQFQSSVLESFRSKKQKICPVVHFE